jgi:hypothetical protein
VGGDNSRQNINNVGIDAEKLRLVFKEVRESLDKIDLGVEERATIMSAAKDVEQELSLPEPKKETLLNKIKSFLAKIKYVPALAVIEEKVLTGLDQSGIDVSNYLSG